MAEVQVRAGLWVEVRLSFPCSCLCVRDRTTRSWHHHMLVARLLFSSMLVASWLRRPARRTLDFC